MGHQMVLCWGGALACQQAVRSVGDVFVMISMELVLEMRPWLCEWRATCGMPAHRFGIGSEKMIGY